MSLIPAASTLGLLGHELRLTLRSWFGKTAGGKRRGLTQAAFGALVVGLITVFAGVPLAYWLRTTPISPTPLIVVIGAAATLAVFTLMLSQTLIGVVRTFYERDDLDLLLTSPVPPMRVLTVKSLGIALNATMVFGLFLTPVLVPAALLASPKWMGLYAVVAALALMATAAALLVALMLFAVIGPRATKTAAQLLAALTGAAFFILSQLQVLLGADQTEGFWMRLARQAQTGEIVPPPGADIPVRAAFGEPTALAIVLAAGFVAFAMAATIVGRRFAIDAAAARGAGSRRRAAPARVGGFASGPFRAMLRKELRLLFRDPGLISQVLLRVLYLIPLAFLVIRSGGDQEGPMLAWGAAAIVFMAGQVGASLSWITISAEDAPGLLGASPAPARVLWAGKLAAAMLPLALLTAVPIAALMQVSPKAALYALVGAAAAGLSAGLINIWQQKPVRRSEFRRRRSSSLTASLAELATGVLFGVSTALAVMGFALWAALMPAVVGLALLVILRQPEGAILRRLAEDAA